MQKASKAVNKTTFRFISNRNFAQRKNENIYFGIDYSK